MKSKKIMFVLMIFVVIFIMLSGCETNKTEEEYKNTETVVTESGLAKDEGLGKGYNYVFATNYNESYVPGAGSAIFMHCKPTGGAGCVAVSEEAMIFILQNIQPGCVLIIDSTTGVYNY